ncbi:hypothetical protein LTR12_009898 [Friedmanniomyces endolithicus]|nr:hypothetical protein LTR74_002536 [Friedmanniomyces endolithicus]KAK1815711.1 hypothetical protein LTR12_009898 [Friedmanniomyces endolithicus]
MAFQQPQQRPQAQVSFTKQAPDVQVAAAPARKRTIEESQEWILFSPQSDRQSHTSQTARTATELGSLETHVRSQPGSCEEATCQGTDADDDNAELDSLDDGLHAFHHHPFSSSSNPLDQSGGTVLPTHDGLGTFPSTAGLQEQLWQFERYNPHRRRHVRRRSSIQRRLDEVEEEADLDVSDDRTARIEKWRLEQSKAVLDEIERETKRRQRRMSRMSGIGASQDIRVGASDSGRLRNDSVVREETARPAEEAERPGESWWQRLTRRVIQDLIGLDENTLSVIFGEELPADPSPTLTQPSPLAARAQHESRVAFHESAYDWELKLLDRIAKELGVLVTELSEHDGAFRTYKEPEYAGLPVPASQHRQPSLQQRKRLSSERMRATPSDALFTPTLLPAPASPMEETDTSLWGIEEEPHQPATNAEATNLQQEREYWERDVDVAMIFSYLRRRFSSTPAPPPQQSQPNNDGPLPASWATTSASALGTSPASLRRADLIRRHHPLVSRAAAQSQRRAETLLRRHQQQSVQKRGGTSSCASQSTKRSRRSGSSRHYWLDGGGGGSLGSAGSGPAGARYDPWGEV